AHWPGVRFGEYMTLTAQRCMNDLAPCPACLRLDMLWPRRADLHVICTSCSTRRSAVGQIRELSSVRFGPRGRTRNGRSGSTIDTAQLPQRAARLSAHSLSHRNKEPFVAALRARSGLFKNVVGRLWQTRKQKLRKSIDIRERRQLRRMNGANIFR